MSSREQIEKYLELTGQTRQELFAGSQSYGMDVIINDLVPQALRERKKIVWKDMPDTLDGQTYSFEDI